MKIGIPKALLSAAAVTVLILASYIFAVIKADTPERLVAELQRAANDGDVESYLSRLTRESRYVVEKSYSDRESLRDAQAEFEKALDEKFGKGSGWVEDANPPPDEDLRAAIGRIYSIEVISKAEAADGSVELKLRTTVKTDAEITETVENTVGARRENDEWRLDLGYPEQRTDAAAIKKEIERITSEVREGKYEDRVAAMIALDNAVRQPEGKQ